MKLTTAFLIVFLFLVGSLGIQAGNRVRRHPVLSPYAVLGTLYGVPIEEKPTKPTIPNLPLPVTRPTHWTTRSSEDDDDSSQEKESTTTVSNPIISSSD